MTIAQRLPCEGNNKLYKPRAIEQLSQNFLLDPVVVNFQKNRLVSSTVSEKWEEVVHHLLVVAVDVVEVDAEVGRQTADQTLAFHQVHHQLLVREQEADAADPLHNQVNHLTKDASIVIRIAVADQGQGLPRINTWINTDLDPPGTNTGKDTDLDLPRTKTGKDTDLDLPGTNTGINTDRDHVHRQNITRKELVTNQRGGQCRHIIVAGFLHPRKMKIGTTIIDQGNILFYQWTEKVTTLQNVTNRDSTIVVLKADKDVISTERTNLVVAGLQLPNSLYAAPTEQNYA